MSYDNIISIVIAGFGGFMLNMINLWTDTKKSNSERVPKDIWYWLFFAFWPCAGAGLAAIYILDGSIIKPFLAFSVGLTAPTTIQSLMNRAALHSGPPPGSET
jgi:hypothetical protein